MVTPKKGDIIRFPRTGKGYSHFAIYIGDGKVIHRASPTDSVNKELVGAAAASHPKSAMAVIRMDDLQKVAGDDSVAEIANSLDATMDPFEAEEVVERAKEKLGEKGYNLIYKNCEHFVMWCRYGIEKSEQVDKFVEKLSSGVQFAIDLAVVQLAGAQKAKQQVKYH